MFAPINRAWASNQASVDRIRASAEVRENVPLAPILGTNTVVTVTRRACHHALRRSRGDCITLPPLPGQDYIVGALRFAYPSGLVGVVGHRPQLPTLVFFFFLSKIFSTSRRRRTPSPQFVGCAKLQNSGAQGNSLLLEVGTASGGYWPGLRQGAP